MSIRNGIAIEKFGIKLKPFSLYCISCGYNWKDRKQASQLHSGY